MSSQTKPRAALAPLALLLIATLCLGALALGFTADDSLITFRYGRNLVEHGVWNWNGDSRDLVEAYTNPLYAFLSVIPHAIGMNVLLFFKALGVAEIGLALLVIWRACGGDRWRFLLNVVFFIHAFAGLETLLYFVLVLHVMTTPRERLAAPVQASLILLAPLVRPEGALISLYLLYCIFHAAPASATRQRAQRSAIAFMLAGAAYFMARYAYFGQLLPNTFYVKGGAGLGTLVYNLYIERSYLLVLLLAWGWLAYRKADLLFPTLQLAGYVLVNLTADLQMNYASRFSFQAAFPLIVHAFILLTGSLDRTRARLLLPVALALSSLLLVNPKEIGRLLTWYPYGLQSHAALGHALAPLQDKGYVMAVGDAGILPYLSGWHTVDYVGLANRNIARSIHDGSRPVFPRPDLIVMYGMTADCEVRGMRFKGADAFFREINPDDYVCAPGPRWSDYYYLHGLIRKDNPDRERITDIFRQAQENAARYGDREALHDILGFRTVLRLY